MLKKTNLFVALCLAAVFSYAQSVEEDSIRVMELEGIVISSTRAGAKTPVAYQNVKKEEIEKRNLGQDLPYILSATTSLVNTSDAGTGIGYTGMRIRGSDATRINVTINGIPYNDSESQGTFWVNMPDFSSSVNSVQIQRGVGTSTNGAGAFGASVNLETDVYTKDAFAEINNTFGSFGTRKHNLILNSGLLNDHWSFEGKISEIHSDGYIDRASADLNSYFLSGNFIGKNTIIKALMFGGQEETYQSWNGVDEGRLLSGRTYNSAGLYYDENGDPQFYDREVDHYNQDHYQLHVNHRVNTFWTLNAALHYTKGKGYFEQYKQDQSFSDYNLPDVEIGDDTISSTDLIRRRWLDNDFYGFTYGVNYDRENLSVVLGGAYNEYSGDHFGEIIWAEYASNSNIRQKYYDNFGDKQDFNTYLKANYSINSKFNLFGDLQLRKVDYHTQGIDSDQRTLDIGGDYTFFNPKFGLTYTVNGNSSIYASFAIGNREPDRNDFIDSPKLPKHETLRDLEIGYSISGNKFDLQANFYYMNYNNQLVLTGALNDVGNSIRANVDDSYRTGIELSGAYSFGDKFHWSGNLTYGQSKIKEYVEDLNDYFEGGIKSTIYEDTDIAFSPEIIGSSLFSFTPVKGGSIGFSSKYVGDQFLDNTSNDSRKINAYFINDILIEYTFTTKFIKEIGLNLMINNVFDIQYESNGYAFGYVAEGSSSSGDPIAKEYREAYYYPQAGINFLAGLKLRF